jgi:hypothetical protein
MRSQVNRDFVELLSTFADHEVEHIVVGAHAAHGCHPLAEGG